MELEKETKKYLDRYTEPDRASNGDVPINILMKALKDGLGEYEKHKRSFDFIRSLGADIGKSTRGYCR